LPTEAEWEYSARAETETARYGELDRIAWYAGNSGGRIREVRQKLPNLFGLYDMLGNVWEWTADWYDEVYYLNSSAFDPTGPTSGRFVVVRSGSWGTVGRGVPSKPNRPPKPVRQCRFPVSLRVDAPRDLILKC
jgi:formylglycine-generating enzyme required for sulfatase activity